MFKDQKTQKIFMHTTLINPLTLLFLKIHVARLKNQKNTLVKSRHHRDNNIHTQSTKHNCSTIGNSITLTIMKM